MPEKDPTTYSMITYMWVGFLSMWGGVVSFLQKKRDGRVQVFNFVEFVGEICTSVFAGMITFFLCEWAGFDKMLSACLIAVSGHMGTRAIYMAEKLVEKHIENRIG